MAKISKIYGVGQALFDLLPPPQYFENPPTTAQDNWSIGQIAYTGTSGSYTFYIYSGAGVWDPLSVDSSSGNLVVPGTITSSLGAITAANGNLVLGTAGNKLAIATGTNASTGTSVAMITGVVTVATTAVTASSIILYARKIGGGTQGEVEISAQVAGTSFTLTSSSATDTSTFNWLIIN